MARGPMQSAEHAQTTEPGGVSAPLDRRVVVVVVAMVTAAVIAYETVGYGVDVARARPLMTEFDRQVPFLPLSIFAYSMVYTSALYPVFVIRNRRLIFALARAVAWMLAISAAFFIAFPVTSAPLRATVTGLDTAQFAQWGVRLTYHVDPPINCFPSLHLAFAALSMLAAYSARPLWGWVAVPNVLGIAISILTMKQHYMADGLAGAALALGLWHWHVRPVGLRERADPHLASDWRGPLGYLGLAAVFYGVFYLAFLRGWQPWVR